MTIKECWIEALVQEGIPRKTAMASSVNPPIDADIDVPEDIRPKAVYDFRKMFRHCGELGDEELVRQFLIKVGSIIQRIDASKN